MPLSKFIWFCTVCAVWSFFTACRAKKALQNELPLFPDQNKTSIYLLNIVPTIQSAEAHSICFLIVTNNTSPGTTQYYMSTFNHQQKTFHYGTAITDSLLADQRLYFPVSTVFEKSDAKHQTWNWFLNRRQFTFFGILDNERLKLKARFKKQYPFLIHHYPGSIAFSEVSALASKISLTWGKKYQFKGTLFITKFADGDILLRAHKNEALIWMNWETENSTANSQLMIMRADSSISSLKPSNILTEPIHLKHKASDTANLKKTYPLHWSLTDTDSKKTYSIIPCLAQQELDLKKSSFWMGAIKVRQTKTDSIKGFGNMYILKP
jgi:hypothetical protein